MKKNVLLVGVLALSAFGLMAISFTDSEPVKGEEKSAAAEKEQKCSVKAPRNFHYDVGTRYSNTITLSQLQKATLVNDIISEDALYSIESMWDIEFFWHKPGKDWSAKGESSAITNPQLDLIELMTYASNFNVYGRCKRKHKETGAIVEGYFDHYYTVVPQKQASYSEGKEALIDYLVSKSASFTSWLDPEKLHPGTIKFTITKDGTVSNVSLESSCGFVNVDNQLVEIVKGLPEKWEAAQNAEGENVDQELTFSFGQVGC